MHVHHNLIQIPDEPAERAYRVFAWIAVRLLSVITRPMWSGAHKVGAGPVLVVSNHISNFDPLSLGHFMLSGARRWPRFIGKAEIWRVPGLGWLARACGQIPVERNSDKARDVVGVAVERIRQGDAVCLYPEGTITADPLGWPMLARSGAARIALEAQCRVVPVGQWGAQEILPGKKMTFPRFWRHPQCRVMAGEPLDLSDLYGRTDSAAVDEATDRIVRAITLLVEEARAEKAPEGIWDPRSGKRVEIHE